MNGKDRSDLSLMMEYLQVVLPEIKTSISNVQKNIEEVNRAIYADPTNKVLGLIDYNKSTQRDMHMIDKSFKDRIENVQDIIDNDVDTIMKKVDKLETLRKRVVWTVSGFGIGTGIMGAGLMELIKMLK
jgi:membrane-anchored protein YejM (alkaline phosphatase superfamily)